MNKDILKTGPQQFIKNNWDTDTVSVLLQKPHFSTITQQELVTQLEAKKKCRFKLPTWFQTSGIYYPNKLHVEQASSEASAAYKAKIVSGNTLIDLSGGMGVDSFFFSKKMESVVHCEINENLSEVVAYNYSVLNVTNVQCEATDGITFLENFQKPIDWMYVDPSRRNDLKGKVFLLKDCLPNVPAHLKSWIPRCENILIKTSPLLDLSQGLKELAHVKDIHILALKNEVKEVLWVLNKKASGAPLIKTVNLQGETTQQFQFFLEEEKSANTTFSKPQKFLYEPNAALLKAGAFQLTASRLKIQKLHVHSHLYTSEDLLETFPGRCFKIEATIPYHRKTFKAWGIKKANVSIRNFPESVAMIRKKLKIADGGDHYLFFTTDLDDKKIIIKCSRITGKAK